VQIVVTGLDEVDLGNTPMSFELPPGAVIHGVPDRDRDRCGVPSSDIDPGRRLAAGLGGVLFTVFKKHAIEMLLDAMATPRVFVTVPEEALNPTAPRAFTEPPERVGPDEDKSEAARAGEATR
jgi:hypothetical protein